MKTLLKNGGRSTFTSDLADAYKKENELGTYIVNHWNATYSTPQGLGSFPDYDVKVHLIDDDMDITFEVKEDKMVSKTGNIAVEFQRTLKDGTVKPTCLSISKAIYYAYYFDNTFWLIETMDLRQIVAEKKYFRIVNNAGEGDRASCYLFKKDVFCKYAKRIENYK